MPIKKPTKKQLFYLRLILSCTILLYLITLIEFDRVKFLLPKLRMGYIWQPFCLLLLSTLAVGIRWSLLLNYFQIKQSMLNSWRYYLVGGFYGIVLPGVIGGDVVRLALSIKSHGRSKALITTSILFERACGFMVILIMASVAAMLLPMLMGKYRALTSLIVGLSLGAIFLFILFFVVLKVSPSSWYSNTRSPGSWKQQAISLLGQFRNLSFGALFMFLFFSLLAHLFDIAGCYFLNRALHIDQPFYIFFLIMPLVYILTILPISIGGIGVREGVFTFFLVKLGVMASDAVLLALFIYVNRVLVGMIGGIIQFAEKKQQRINSRFRA